jgi:arginine exporter protein ArgO
MFLMSLADERYLALQLVFFSGALMLIYCAWVMVKNLEEAPEPAQPQEETQPDDGFEHL